MAAGVRQGHMLAGHMPSMGDQTDVGMEREDLGPMMSTESQVCSVYLRYFMFQKCVLRPSNTGNIFVQLMRKNCCIAS